MYPQLTIASGAKGALENRIGFLHVCNELGDWAQIKSSIGFVIQKLMLFKVSFFVVKTNFLKSAYRLNVTFTCIFKENNNLLI